MAFNFFKNFFKSNDNTPNRVVQNQNRKVDKEGRIHVPMHTEVFSQVGPNLLISNSLFSNFMTDILACIDTLKLKDKITIDAYETNNIDDVTQEVVTVGFKKYVNSCIAALRRQILTRLILFSIFFIFGVVIEFILYGVLNGVANQMWIFKSAEVLASLFIWQFGGYLAFEYFGARKTMIRYKQILGIKFNIKHWE